jgi:hypothetical protein
VVDVDAQDLAPVVVEVLGVAVGIAHGCAVAEAGVEVPVGAEAQIGVEVDAPDVGLIEVEDHPPAGGRELGPPSVVAKETTRERMTVPP